MKTVAYNGPYSAVEVPSLGVTAEKGDPIEVAEDVAQALLRQGWQEVKAKKEIAK
ncbi:hypothetical protein [Streptomyces sp. A1547]|uniref:hypothetical protein n=1 Tax=Streptomyces TaxID=1883 RepID=UPI00144A9F64|nr:hypothetical protein [Streptomyces sp. A1547]